MSAATSAIERRHASRRDLFGPRCLPDQDLQRRARGAVLNPRVRPMERQSRRVHPSPLSSLPVLSHCARHHPSARRPSHHCLAVFRRASAQSYLRHAPSLWRLNHLDDLRISLAFSPRSSAAPQSRHRVPAGCHRPSSVSDELRWIGHVGRAQWPVPMRMPGAPAPGQFPPTARMPLAISGGRTQKFPLTRRTELFPIRLHLRSCLPARA